jgi:hypothetical protein
MNCDEVELMLPEGTGDEAVAAHLLECATCRETAAVLGLAVQGPLSAGEKAKLSGLPVAVQAEWSRLQRRRDAARKFIGLAVAASLGAVVASGLMWKLTPAPLQQPLPVESQLVVTMDDLSLPAVVEDDASFEEVSWPSLND